MKKNKKAQKKKLLPSQEGFKLLNFFMEDRVCKKGIKEFFSIFFFFLPASLVCKLESILCHHLVSYTL